NALLVSGIGRPKAFYKLMSTQLETNIVGHIEFKDHHPYTQQDIQRILHTMENLNAKMVFVTEKDAIKLKALIANRPEFISVGLQAHVRGLELALRKEGVLS